MPKYDLPKDYEEKQKIRISKLSNSQLLNDALFLTRGDDWEGEFTECGETTCRLLIDELEKRLKEIKFLKSKEKIDIIEIIFGEAGK